MKDGASSDKTDPWDDLGRNAGVISDVHDSEFVREKCKHRRPEADEEIGAQAGWPMLELALHADQAAQDRRQHQAQNRNSDDGSHLSQQNLVNVVPVRHENVGWLDFITGKRCPNALLRYTVNGRDYQE
jgi:hypothetical protein